MVTFTTTETATNMILAGMPAAALANGGDLLVRERARPVVSTGFRSLDALLPAGGVRPGSLVEWLAEGRHGAGGIGGGAEGGGAATLAFAVACRLAAASEGVGDRVGDPTGSQRRPRTIVVVDRTGWFHPPAVLPWLGDERRLVVARPSRDDDEIWTIDQALRCTGVAAVLAWPRARHSWRSSSTRAAARPGITLQQWSTAMRRWQLAAAGSGAVGMFVRPAAARSEPSWAEARIAVSPQPGGTLTERRLRLTLVGGSWAASSADGGRSADVMLDLGRGCAGSLPGSGGGRGLPAAAGFLSMATQERIGAACRAS